MKNLIIIVLGVFFTVTFINAAVTNTKNSIQPLSVTLESPADADNFLLFKSPYGITITDIDCVVDPGDSSESAVIDIQECDAAGDNCATVDAGITCDNDGAADDGAFSNGSIDSGDWVALDIGAITGTVSQVAVTIKYEESL